MKTKELEVLALLEQISKEKQDWDYSQIINTVQDRTKGWSWTEIENFWIEMMENRHERRSHLH